MRHKITIANKIVFFLFWANIFFFVLLSLFISRYYKDYVYSRNAKLLQASSQLVGKKVVNDFDNLRDILVFVASHNETLRAAVEKANASYEGVPDGEILARMKAMDADWDKGAWERLASALSESKAADILKDFMTIGNLPLSEVFITDIKGALVATSEKTADYYQADEDWWKAVEQGGPRSFYFSGLEYDQSRGFMSFFMACPILDARQHLIGVLKGVIGRDRDFLNIFRYYLGKDIQGGVISSTGQGLFVSDPGLHRDAQFLRALFDNIKRNGGNGSSMIQEASGEIYIVGFSKIALNFREKGAEWYFYATMKLSDVFNVIRGFAWTVLAAFFFLMLIFYAASTIFIRRLLLPINALKAGFKQAGEGCLDTKVEIATGDEFQELAGDFNRTLGELRVKTVARDYFDKVLHAMSDMLFVVDPFGAIELVNQKVCDVLGYSPQELKGMEAVGLFSKKDRYILGWGLKGLIDEGELKDKRVYLLKKSGEEIEVYIGTRSLKDENNNFSGLVCVAKDLSEINKMLDDLKRSNDEAVRHEQELEKTVKDFAESKEVMLSVLEDTDESKKALEDTLARLQQTKDQLLQAEKMISLGQISAGVAHEINNPLFVISGEMEMLAMEEGLPKGAKESVENIRNQARRIEEIIRRLLEFSRKKEIKFIPFEINDVLSDSVELLNYQVKIMGHVDIVKNFWTKALTVFGDKNQLREVFLNIMLNAVQAMEEKGGSLTIRTFSEILRENELVFTQFKTGDHVAGVEIVDTGPGMEEATVKKIFDPFFTTKKTGTGLGLSVVFGILENHKAHIQVRSKPGEGTAFTIRFPQAKQD